MLKYRADLDFSSAEGFDDIILKAPPSGFPKLVIQQGEVGKIRIVPKRQFTGETLWVMLSLHGIAPNFDRWMSGLAGNQSLPEGITFAINPPYKAICRRSLLLNPNYCG
jgi:hypothetical protein